MDIILIIITAIFDFIILLAFFKMSSNTTAIKEFLLHKPSNNIREARADYYKYLALGDNKAAHEQLLYIIFYELTEPTLNKENKKLKYDNLKDRYLATFTKLGYEFPDFPF